VQREVAIKIILPRYASQPDFIRRFEVEAQLVAQLEHLHIVPLYDFWRDPEGAYLVMRLMKGGSLAEALDDGPLEPGDAIRLVDQITAALGAAHQQGVVHRDLKPANILLDEEGNAYLSDFGIAKKLAADTRLTQTGAIVGTPAYITPEQVRSEAVTHQTDIYSLGLVLYEILVGGHPFPDTPTGELVSKHLHEPLPLVRDSRPELPAEVDQVIQRATAKDPAGRYEDVLTLVEDFRSALQPVLRVAPEVPEREIYNPYKGLRAFQEVDADDFFGREALVGQLLAKLVEKGESSRFLAVVGPSGSGKSSVVKAGLVPALRKGALPGSEDWFITEMVPGAHPLEELELALLRIAVQQPPGLLEQLEKDERGLLRAVRRVLLEEGELLLVIDQLEEVFTLVKEPGETAFFMQSLYEALVDPHSPLRVIATLRADFYDRPLTHPDFSALVRERTEVVVPLNAEELEDAIRAPAERVGVMFESALVSTVVGDVLDQPGALPLLQYALTELFEQREGRLLTCESYQSIGGVLGALGRRAEEVYTGLDAAGKRAARQLFLRLVTLGEGIEDTRRRVLRTELEGLIRDWDQGVGDREQDSAIRDVIDAFGEARLLSFDNDPLTRRPTVEVAHEALLYEWRRLREWLDESRSDIRMQRVLANSASEWLEAERDPGFLLREARLDQFEAWSQGTSIVLTADEHAFLEVSLEERRIREVWEAERRAHEAALERRSRNFLRALTLVLAVAAVVAVILSAVAFNQRSVAQKNALLADQSATTATVAQGRAQWEAATAVAAQGNAQYQADQAALQVALAEEAAAAEALARQEAEKTSRLSRSRELVAFTLTELDQPSDVSRSLALLLAREAVLTTLTVDDYVVGPAEAVLRRAIKESPVLYMALYEHTAAVNSAAWSPDSRFFVTASDDHTAKVWDAETGEILHNLSGHTSEVNATSWSSDGSKIATASADSSVRIWDSTTGTQIGQLDGHRRPVNSVMWSPDGNRIATASDDGYVLIWDVNSGDQLIQLQLYSYDWGLAPGIIKYATFSPDGNQIMTATDDPMVRIWNSHTGEEMGSLEARAGRVYSANWSHAGSRLVTTHDRNGAYIWNSDSGEVIHELKHSIPVLFADWNPDDTEVVTVSIDGVVHIWDSLTGTERRKFQATDDILWSVAWSPDGEKILTAGDDGVVWIWEAGDPSQYRTLEHAASVLSARWSPYGADILTAAGFFAYTWDVVNLAELQHFPQYSMVSSADWHPDGGVILTTDFNGVIKLWDAESGGALDEFSGHTGWVNDSSWNHTGNLLVSAGQDRTARIWDKNSGEVIHILRGHIGEVMSATWDPQDERVITTSKDQTARIWDVETGEELIQLMGHTGRVNSADWNPDGRLVVTGGSDRTVRIWDAQTGEELDQLSGHLGAVQSVDWSPTGLQIVSAGEDRTARIWDAQTGEQVGQISGHEGTIWSATWSLDGTQVLTASGDRTARIWPVGIEGLLKQAEDLILRDPPEFTAQERCIYLHECGEGE
jgi:WD40 repeat protein